MFLVLAFSLGVFRFLDFISFWGFFFGIFLFFNFLIFIFYFFILILVFVFVFCSCLALVFCDFVMLIVVAYYTQLLSQAMYNLMMAAIAETCSC